jgi:hypothetical protein
MALGDIEFWMGLSPIVRSLNVLALTQMLASRGEHPSDPQMAALEQYLGLRLSRVGLEIWHDPPGIWLPLGEAPQAPEPPAPGAPDEAEGGEELPF